MITGYTDNLIDNLAYISIVGVVSQYRRYGYATTPIEEFLEICRDKRVCACHVYTDERNLNLVEMYTKCGFQRYLPQKEDRPEDLHLICYLK